jgi:hypothetical protein
MAEFLLSLVIIVAALAGLGLGRLLGRPGLKGSCGGLAGTGDGSCACRDASEKGTAP